MGTDGPKFTVLIADDVPMFRTLVERSLAAENLKVLVAASGNEAVALYEEHHPEIVLTDWMMPDLTGMELCKYIREKHRAHYSYIIIITAMPQKEKLVAALEAGADDYLTKPFNRDELVARVRVGRRLIQLQKDLEQRNRWLEQLSLTDPLTNLPNRRALEEWSLRELHAAQRHHYPVTLVVADIDHFKAINDTHGHAAGDAVLKQFADLLLHNTRQSDLLARLGGEEFVLFCRQADCAHALPAVERLRVLVAQTPFDVGGQKISVTASFGLAECLPAEKPNLEHLLRAADQALYAAKGQGRNCVVQAGSPPVREATLS